MGSSPSSDDLMGRSPFAEDEASGGLATRRMRTALRGELFGVDVGPIRIGRFAIVGELGRGGMGTVYRAYDPELDRAIAVKVVRPDPRIDTEQLRRDVGAEAKALAKLNHPNVLAVHDVGVSDGQVFLAMELVEGTTLAQWCREHPIGERGRFVRLAELARQAASGLAAAHVAGLVHRDLKPSNVLVGRDGRVRIADFGLAFEASESEPTGGRADESRTAAGTPGYMAPEQLRGVADARSDQFGWCVTFYEACFATKPYDASALERWSRDDGAEPTSHAPTERHDVPGWMLRLLRRGLSLDPTERFASMDVIAGELDVHLRGRRRRRAVAVAAVVAAMPASAAAYVLVDEHRRGEACDRVAAEIDDEWSPEVESSIAVAFEQLELPSRSLLFGETRPELDAYAQAWASARRDACSAQTIADESLAVRQHACLAARKRSFGALLDVLATVDEAVALKATDLARALPPIEECSDPEWLARTVALPDDDVMREQVDALELRLAEIVAERRAGRYARAFDLSGPVSDSAEEVGYAPLLARALLERGRLAAALDHRDDARSWLTRAYHEAGGAGDDLIAAEAAGELIVNEHFAYDVDAARPWFEHGMMMLRRADAVESGRAGALLQRFADVLIVARELDTARAHTERAIDLLVRERGEESPGVMQARSTLARIAAAQGRADEALVLHREMLALARRIHGPDHPLLVAELIGAANASMFAADFPSALEFLDDALRITETTLGPTHHHMALILSTQGRVLASLGRRAEGLERTRRALELAEADPGSARPTLFGILGNLAVLEMHEGHLDDAGRHLERALQIAETTFGPDAEQTGSVLTQLANVRSNQSRHEEALELRQRSLEILRAALGAEHPETAAFTLNLAGSLSELGRHEEALTTVRAANEIIATKLGPTHPDLGHGYGTEAHALAGLGRKQDAIDVYRKALGIFEAARDEENVAFVSQKIAELEP